MNWLFWQMGSAPFLGGGFGHFYEYAPIKIQYAIDRYAMEVKRQLDVLNRQLANNEFIAGDEYSIADMAILPWYGRLAAKAAYSDAAISCRWTNTNMSSAGASSSSRVLPSIAARWSTALSASRPSSSSSATMRRTSI